MVALSSNAFLYFLHEEKIFFFITKVEPSSADCSPGSPFLFILLSQAFWHCSSSSSVINPEFDQISLNHFFSSDMSPLSSIRSSLFLCNPAICEIHTSYKNNVFTFDSVKNIEFRVKNTSFSEILARDFTACTR